MPSFDIEVFDTREDTVCVVRGVPGNDLVDACKNVAEKKGYVFVKAVQGSLCYAIDVPTMMQWEIPGTNEQEALEELRQHVLDGALDEARGLYQLFQHEDDWYEDWDEE